MRTIVTFIVFLIIIKVTDIDKVVWPAIQHGFATVNRMIQGA